MKFPQKNNILLCCTVSEKRKSFTDSQFKSTSRAEQWTHQAKKNPQTISSNTNSSPEKKNKQITFFKTSCDLYEKNSHFIFGFEDVSHNYGCSIKAYEKKKAKQATRWEDIHTLIKL